MKVLICSVSFAEIVSEITCRASSVNFRSKDSSLGSCMSVMVQDGDVILDACSRMSSTSAFNC